MFPTLCNREPSGTALKYGREDLSLWKFRQTLFQQQFVSALRLLHLSQFHILEGSLMRLFLKRAISTSRYWIVLTMASDMDEMEPWAFRKPPYSSSCD